MKYNYYNPVTREYGHIEKRSFHLLCGISLNRRYPIFVRAETFDEADAFMEEHGYKRMGIIDESGCRRYTMTLPQLQELYKKFEEFVADCTQEEYNENKAAITAVYTLIHKHLNAETMK